MKRIIYIFSAILLTFFSCTDEVLDSDSGKVIVGNKVQLNFRVNDLPDFKPVTRAGSETQVETISLMTFDASGNFLGRVEAKVNQINENPDSGTASGTGSALVPIETSTIHFIANYDWKDDAYVIPEGETEISLMSILTSDKTNFYVAWGCVRNVNLSQTIAVEMLRNYAKVTVEAAEGCDFVVGGFALSHYATKGTVVAEEGSLNVPADCTFENHKKENCNTEPKYMYEYENTYDRQTSVIVERKGKNQFYKIQLLDKEGTPYPIERNYVYRVIINKIEEGAEGSPSFEAALEASPTNNIYVEVIKEASTVSDKTGNKLIVDPVFHLFVNNGTLKFNANYYPAGSNSTDNGQISVKLVHNGHQQNPILPGITDETTLTVGNDGIITANVELPANRTNLSLDSAMLRVNAGVLTRIVTVFISKQYDFDPQPVSYKEDMLGQEVPLTFTIPSDFPTSLLPIKCYIKADGLNPAKVAGQKDMLVENRNGSIYYVYEAETTGTKTLIFKTIQDVIDTYPTITNEYFADGTFAMNMEGKSAFTNMSAGPAFYENGSTFTLKFTMESDAPVTISGNGIVTIQNFPGKAGINEVTVTTNKHGAIGTIQLAATGYLSGRIDYTNNYILQKDYQITNANLKRSRIGGTSNIDQNVAITVTPADYITGFMRPSNGKYSMTIRAGVSVNEELNFACHITGTVLGLGDGDYADSKKISELITDSSMTLGKQ
ncbi:hypothetical protein [Parabacteroides sp. AM08-6]|uniref:hypothetical protein n=1 Tax=Parabacteroides sp. AM08-6 TaxID=2292053 RepID=UPI000EFEF6D4|nr:hypothetical protein [Parabacteroides sp. AM08-6]RHJ79572.1 hypothetical protein DW103_13370 [Parabacteroides sp. AM08-6]